MVKINLDKVNLKDAAFFRYKVLNGQYLLTNEVGQHIFLGKKEFEDFIEARLEKGSLTYNSLDQKNFIHKTFDNREIVRRYLKRYGYLRKGSSLHIVIPTLRCNHRCVYCQAGSRSLLEKGYDMDEQIARKVVDTIFKCPGKDITLEFQGGEPLVNWKITAFIIDYALKKNKKLKKKLKIALVTNLTLMTKDRLRFLLKNKVSICTSLDGPKFIHDRNRPMIGAKSGYEITTKWIKELSYLKGGFRNALVTLTRFSLDYPEEIIHEYLKWNIFSIPLRPVSVLGFAGLRRKEIGVTAEEFLVFYRRAIDYMIELTYVTGQRIGERMARVILRKIFNPSDPGYLDMRSPCGAGCGQVAYMYDGSVYSCDEGRMIGDDSFKLGNVFTHSYQELMQSKTMQACVFASCLDGLYCDYCAYKPYCGVCPVVNWKEYGSIYARSKGSFMCKIYEGMFDYIFELLQDKNKADILRSWIR